MFSSRSTTNGATPPVRDWTPVAGHSVGSRCMYGLIWAVAEQTVQAVNALVTAPMVRRRNTYKPRYELCHSPCSRLCRTPRPFTRQQNRAVTGSNGKFMQSIKEKIDRSYVAFELSLFSIFKLRERRSIISPSAQPSLVLVHAHRTAPKTLELYL